MATATVNDAKRPMQRWQERSKTVALSRKVLPALILAIVVGMGGWTIVRTLLPGKLLTAQVGAPMVNPRFHGRDDNDKPFLIGAIQAIRDQVDQKKIVLNNPFVTFGQSRLSAKTGVYRPDESTISLLGGVVFDDGDGRRLTTDQAIVNVKAGSITGETTTPGGGVNIAGPFGTVHADSYSVTEQGERVSLRGNVRAQFNDRL